MSEFLRDNLYFAPRRGRFSGIGEAARRLGVTRVHLYLVLRGSRQSKALSRRYEALKQEVAAR